MKVYSYSIFGREVIIERHNDGWLAFFQGPEGKRRPAGIIIPFEITEGELAQYLSDLCHEWASERYQDVILLKETSIST
ncbi:hypothetical protein Misp06_03127 [Microbulbifer sp. NBRC 101763]|uniref:DUF7661 family protein n=1 Tax=unclassified Microbulbifer TaxID=2619833 RepID=UPI0030A20727